MNDLEFVGDYRQPHLSARQRAHGHDGSSAGEFSFGDFIDIINPLQHIPVVSTLYREITGDEISPHARIFGGTLYGGPMGFVSAIANVFYEEVAGEDIGETMIALFTGEETEGDPQFAKSGAEAAPLETAAGTDPDSNTASILPEAARGMLTGQDALDALFLDLGGRQAGPPIPAPPPAAAAQAAQSYPLAPRHVRVGAADPPPEPTATTTAGTTTPGANPLLFAQEAGEGAIADRMMQALDKYRAMSQPTRRGDDREDPEDKSKRVIWQSDPGAANGT